MENSRRNKIRKPEGVYILCLLMFLNFGVYQFFNDFSAMRQVENETPLIIAILLISFDVFSAASAIWTFFGDNYGRISLLIFVTLSMLWSIFVLIMMIGHATPKADGYYDGDIFLFGFSLIKPLFLFGLCWWYFNRKDVVAYYRQDNQYEFF